MSASIRTCRAALLIALAILGASGAQATNPAAPNHFPERGLRHVILHLAMHHPIQRVRSAVRVLDHLGFLAEVEAAVDDGGWGCSGQGGGSLLRVRRRMLQALDEAYPPVDGWKVASMLSPYSTRVDPCTWASNVNVERPGEKVQVQLLVDTRDGAALIR